MAAGRGRRAADLRSHAAGDDGQVMLLSIAYGVLALLLVTVVVSASAVHLARKELLMLADLAALEAADSMDVATYYSAGHPGRVTLTSTGVATAVDGYLAVAPLSDRLGDLAVVSATAPDARTARVTLTAVAEVPLLTMVTAAWSDGVVLEVTAEARAD